MKAPKLAPLVAVLKLWLRDPASVWNNIYIQMENVMNVNLLVLLVLELIQMNVLLVQMVYTFNQTIILAYTTVILDIMAIQLSKNV